MAEPAREPSEKMIEALMMIGDEDAFVILADAPNIILCPRRTHAGFCFGPPSNMVVTSLHNHRSQA